jgi:hypothetical protein
MLSKQRLLDSQRHSCSLGTFKNLKKVSCINFILFQLLFADSVNIIAVSYHCENMVECWQPSQWYTQ